MTLGHIEEVTLGWKQTLSGLSFRVRIREWLSHCSFS